MDGLLALAWALSGIFIHAYQCDKMKTWCGTPIWQEPSAWAMFIPAMIAGPLQLFFTPPEGK